ncbi:MAG: PPC domain-containing DNA-binding protein [Christensenellaceae bacterium]|jgi:predicted DNA-binding protein with PD1-like motif
MEYKKFDTTWVIRLDPGDEIVSSLKAFAEKEHVFLASVSGLGAVNRAVLGLFDPQTKVYTKNTVEKNMEIVSLVGTVSTMDGETYLHLHMSVADAQAGVYGGHLNEAHVSATAELTVTEIAGKADRAFSQEIGLNLLKFD